MKFEGTTALVTGANSGIGAEFSRRLAQRGADLVLVARRAGALEEVAAEIRVATGRVVHVVPFDLSVDRAGYRLRDEFAALGLSVDSVINCAGFGITRNLKDSSEDEIRRQLRLNIDTVVEISHAFLPQLVRSGRGALVNVGSLTAYMPVPGMAVYAAAKSFVVRFTEALAYETRGMGVTVMAFSPGPTRTEFYDKSGTATSGVRFHSAAQVVNSALRALDKSRTPVSTVSGRANNWVRRLMSVLPSRMVLQLATSTPSGPENP